MSLGRRLRYADHPAVQRVFASRRVDARLFGDLEAQGLLRIGSASALVPDFEALASERFDPGRVHPSVVDFYERTTERDIRVSSFRWRTWARAFSVPYRRFAERTGNMRVPISIDDARDMSSDVRDVDLFDGGASRYWVRTYAGVNDVFYVATVRDCVVDGYSYLSLAFPIPGAQIAVVLGVENHEGEGLRVSTTTGPLGGTYLVRAVDDTHFRLFPGPPTTEELTFRGRGTDMLGTHRDRLFGMVAFEMEYTIR